MTTYETFLNQTRGIVDKLLRGIVETETGEMVRVDPQQVRARFADGVAAFLKPWLQWHDAHNTKTKIPTHNPIDWPNDRSGVFDWDACAYTTLAVIHDWLASATEPDGRIIDLKTKGWLGLRISMFESIRTQEPQAGYTKECIESCIRYVSDELSQREAQIKASAAEPPTKSPVQLEADAFTILCNLADSPTRLKQADLQECTKPSMDRHTVSRHLKQLTKLGFVDYNPSDKKGASITQAGKAYLQNKQ